MTMGSGGKRRPSVEQEGQQLVERLGGVWSPNGGMCRCPAHDDRTPSLSVRPGRTRLLLHCFAGCEPSAILRALGAQRLLDPSAGGTDTAQPRRGEGAGNAAALRLWDEARSITGTPAAAYLASRGLETTSAQLRYHSRTPHGPGPLTLYRPALIAAVRDDSGLVAIHRTFIDPRGGGLAPLADARRGLGRLGRGAVRLGLSAPRLGLAEGIETALSATALFGVPCWATLGTERFGRVALPHEVRELLLFLDHDAGGRRAERLAREAFAHVPRIETHVPEHAGDDWNDVLRTPAGNPKA
ncbi:MAG TPA: toprim domain-containing protein [Allosphingosinicella sp.]